MRSFALLALGLVIASASPGEIGFLVINLSVGANPQTHTGKSFGQAHPLTRVANEFFTILSSSEWKLITHNLPPVFSLSGAILSISEIKTSSLLIAILSA
jgi:hypothetical protein